MLGDVMHRIIKERKIYILIIFELLICFTVTTYGLDHYFSGRKALGKMDADLGEYYLQLKINSNGKNVDDTGFTPTDQEIAELRAVSHGTMMISAYTNETGFQGETPIEYNNIFCSGLGLRGNEVYASSTLIHKLSKCDVFSDDISFKEGSLIYHGREYKVRCMPRQIRNRKIIVDEHGKYIKLSSGIVFPLDNSQAYSDYRDSKNDNYFSTNISFNKGVLDENGKVLNRVFKKLAYIDGGKHTFILQNTRKEGQRLNQYIGLIPSYLGKMGLVMLLIVSLGIFGNLKNILRRRKKEIAIRMALGEQIPCMLNAFVVEFSIVFSIGTLLGVILGEVLRNIYSFDAMFTIGFSYWTLIISFAWVLIIVAISTLTVFMKIKDNLPSVILTEQE
ncbi:ABC transporter permease [Mogibacterium diversum]|uniref:ABC transporter permease n=1 Tax=Mogibacterium diversum TaxID=114527 RepID=UPI0026EF5AB6|nr:ABC transporter permease [Mogibacterium diversum]